MNESPLYKTIDISLTFFQGHSKCHEKQIKPSIYPRNKQIAVDEVKISEYIYGYESKSLTICNGTNLGVIVYINGVGS